MKFLTLYFYIIILYINIMLTYQEKYNKYKNKYLQLKQNINLMKGGNAKTLTLIKADWCKHCNKFMSSWHNLPKHISGINFKLLDSKKDKQLINEYNISGFPSIFLENGNKKIEFKGERNIENIKNFVEKTI